MHLKEILEQREMQYVSTGADLGKKMTGGTLNMITKLALYLVVCEGLVIHLCGGTHHGEKLSCTTTSNF